MGDNAQEIRISHRFAQMNTDQKQEAGGGKKRIGLSHRFAQMNTDQKQKAGRPETEEIRMRHCFSLRWGLRRQRTSDISR